MCRKAQVTVMNSHEGSEEMSLDRVEKLLGCIPTARKRSPNSKQPQPKKTPKKKATLLCNLRGPAGILKRGETGASKSCPSTNLFAYKHPVSNPVQAAGDTPTSPSFGWKRPQVFPSMLSKSPLAGSNDATRSSGDKIGPPVCQMDCFCRIRAQHSAKSLASRKTQLALQPT